MISKIKAGLSQKCAYGKRADSSCRSDCISSHTLSPGLDLPKFWPGTEMKREVWLLRTWFGPAPVYKLVSLTWLLWALRNFLRFKLQFALHYITLHYIKKVETKIHPYRRR